MKPCCILLIPLALAAFVAPASAGIIFGKRAPKPNPAEIVPELLATAKNDQDEHKRTTAVEELRQYDPANFPEMVPVLLMVLRNDPKPAVRSEAATTLSKLRPVSQQVGAALEQSMAHDDSMRVRLQARSALLFYHWAGYHTTKPMEPPQLQSKEPPFAQPGDMDPTMFEPPPPQSQVIRHPPMMIRPGETMPPPLIEPEKGNAGSIQPLPEQPSEGLLVPTETPHLKSPPTPGDGPDLSPN
jgi:HEAT repeats